MIAAGERSEIRFGQTSIAYGIRRSSRRATVAIAIDPRDGVVLTAPADTPIARLDRLVHAKARWIIEKLRRRSDLPPPLPVRELVSGETFLYLGRQYRLKVERAEAVDTQEAMREAEVGLWRARLVVRVSAELTEAERADHVRRALVAWYRGHAGERIPERVALWAKRLGVPAPGVTIREPRKRWGSCDAQGTLRFNWRVIQAPMRLVDYVVAHELAHLQHRDHTAEFWATLGRVMPDYESRRERLRKLGPTLAW